MIPFFTCPVNVAPKKNYFEFWIYFLRFLHAGFCCIPGCGQKDRFFVFPYVLLSGCLMRIDPSVYSENYVKSSCRVDLKIGFSDFSVELCWKISGPQIIGLNAVVLSDYKILWSSLSLEGINQYLRVFAWMQSPRKGKTWHKPFLPDIPRHVQPHPKLPRLDTVLVGLESRWPD